MEIPGMPFDATCAMHQVAAGPPAITIMAAAPPPRGTVMAVRLAEDPPVSSMWLRPGHVYYCQAGAADGAEVGSGHMSVAATVQITDPLRERTRGRENQLVQVVGSQLSGNGGESQSAA